MRALFIFPLILPACFGAINSEHSRAQMVSDRAKFDLSCGGEEVQVQKISDTSYGAIGCGKKATYVLSDCHGGAYQAACKVSLDSVQEGGGTRKPEAEPPSD